MAELAHCFGRGPNARLQQAKAGTPALIERNNFAIENGVGARERRRNLRQLRILLLNATAGARQQFDLAIRPEEQRADSIPLQLEEPLRTFRQRGRRGGQHGRDFCRHRRLHRARHTGGINRRGLYAAQIVFCVPSGLGGEVFFLDEQPFVALAAVFHARQGEIAQKLFSVQAEFHVAALHLLGKRCFTEQLVAAPIPHTDAAGAVIAFRYRALKVAVLQRMVFHQHGQTFFCRIERGTLGDCPGFQNTLGF